MSTALIVLAAGQGTRMNSDLPKVLHSLGGFPLFAHALKAATALGAEKTVLVVGHGAKDVSRAASEHDPNVLIVEQPEQNGTADAVKHARADVLFDLVDAVNSNNAAGEYYLTDIVAIARERGLSATAVTCEESETIGINTRPQLAAAEAAFQARARSDALENGVTLVAPDTVYFALDTVLGRDVTIEPNVVFGPGVTVESGARIRAFSHLEGCHVGAGAIVGPFARLRPGAELSNDVRIGNFVEIKNAQIGDGAKVNHLTYVGDADIGEGSNIGAGTVTCNYDGVNKHRTTIGRNVFIGSDTMLVAPVKIGDNAMTASGSVVNRDVPEGGLGIARARQENKPGFALRWFEKLKSTGKIRDKGQR